MRLVPPGDALYLWVETASSPTSVVALQTFRLPDGAGQDTLDELYAAMTNPTTVKRSFRQRPTARQPPVGSSPGPRTMTWI
jgi:hypothetical protein